MMGRGLIDSLYAECDGFIEFRAKLPNSGRKGMDAISFLRPDDFAGINKFLRQHKGMDIWYGVATRDGQGGKKDNLIHIPALWTDMDWKTYPGEQEGADKVLSDFPLKPTIKVVSGGGYHVYWLLKEPHCREDIPEVERVLRKITTALKGDPACVDASRILRVPNTRNFKYLPPRAVKLDYLNGSQYNLGDFEFLPEPAEEYTATSSRDSGEGLNRIMECVFMQYCRDHSKEVSEPEWYCMITQLAKEIGGRDLIHRLSKNYPGYKKNQTDEKILHAVSSTGPQTCGFIKSRLNFQCGLSCGVSSPAGLAFRNVTFVTKETYDPNVTSCNRLVTNVTSVTSATGEEITLNLASLVKDWLETCDGVFTLRDMAQELQLLYTKNHYNNLKLILKRLADSNVIVRVGDTRGTYRKRENDSSVMPWWDAGSEEEFSIQLPLDLSELAKVYPRNIIVIAGTKDSGKTTLSLNIAKDNLNREVHYWTSEMSTFELRERLANFKNIDLQGWRAVQFHDVNANWEDHILRYPDALHIIDFLEIHDEFWKIGGQIRRIYDALRNGCCIINLQKKTGADYAKGGEVTIEKARLYLNLDRKFDREIPYTRIHIKSAKIPRDQGRTVSGLVRDYQVDWGWRIVPLTDWEFPQEEVISKKRVIRY